MQSFLISDLLTWAVAFLVGACVLCGVLLYRMQRVVNLRSPREDYVSFFSLRPRGARERRVLKEYRRVYPRSDLPRLFRFSQWTVGVALAVLLLCVVIERV